LFGIPPSGGVWIWDDAPRVNAELQTNPAQFASVIINRYYEASMDDPNETPRRHRWPWLVLAAFLLGVALAVLWISFEVRHVERERDFNAPLPSSPAR
jgi:hypothetical protein